MSPECNIYNYTISRALYIIHVKLQGKTSCFTDLKRSSGIVFQSTHSPTRRKDAFTGIKGKGKGKGGLFCTAPCHEHTSKALRYGTCFQGISQFVAGDRNTQEASLPRRAQRVRRA